MPRQCPRKRVPHDVVYFQHPEHDARSIEPLAAADAIGNGPNLLGPPGLQSGDRVRRLKIHPLFQFAHHCAAHRQQHLRGIGDIHAVFGEHGEGAIAKGLRVLCDLAAERLEPLPVVHVGRLAHLALELASKKMDLDDLIGTRDALGLGERHRVDRVARRPAQLQRDVAHQLSSRRGEVARTSAGTLVHRVAVHHRADGVAAAQVVEGEVHRRAMLRVADRVAVALCEAGADEVLHDVELDRCPSDIRPEVSGLRAGAVLEVRMREATSFTQRSERGERLHSGLGDRELVGPADHVVRRILADVADGGDARRERATGIVVPSGEPDHVVADVRLDRHRLREPLPLVRSDAWPGLLHRQVPLRLRHAHRPIERQTEAIDAVALCSERSVHGAQRILGGLPRRETDVHVVHHLALVAAATLVVHLGR